MWKEFKEFAFKGNVIDMAVGVIIGGAFGKIVTSLVNDVIMPVIGFLVGGTDFKALKIILSPAQLDANGAILVPEAAILYGNFIQNVVDLLLIAACIFFMVKLMNKLRFKKAVEPAPVVEKKPTTEELLIEIRDCLKNK